MYHSVTYTCISIHTHALGVTYVDEEDEGSIFISIHTHAPGVTKCKSRCTYNIHDFNPHSRTGCDLRCDLKERKNDDFNPHSRTGCDAARTAGQKTTANFNPHSRTGSDCEQVTDLRELNPFQSTLPHWE